MRSKILAFCFLLTGIIPFSSHAFEIQAGLKGALGGGYPSGKGLWDWTDTAEEGTLDWGPGAGGGLVLLFDFKSGKYQIETGPFAGHIRADQTLGAEEYQYVQNSLEIPLLFKQRLPFEKTWYLGVGPAFIFIPGKSRRTGGGESVESVAYQRAAVALQVGVDRMLMSRGKWDLRASFNFLHPLTSPEYAFEAATSGSIRINRVDIGLAILYSVTGDGSGDES